MSLIFLSHSSVDEPEAVALKQWLLDNGWDDVFLDLDPERGLKAGERWQEALRRAADRCEAVVFIISPAWAKSKWCLTEFLLAKSLNKLIFGVVVKETELSELPTELTAEYQLTQLIGKGSTETIHFVHHEHPADIPFLANGLGRLRFGLQTAGLSANFFPWPPEDDKSRAPYRGLEPLDAKDAAVFFGRDAEILQGLDRLRGMRAAGDEGLFVILGPSGSGKSSFLRAGLLPRLARNARYFYPLEIIRPERRPLEGERGLANAICRANEHLRLMPANLGEVKMALAGCAERLGELLLNIQNAARYQLLGLPEDAPPPTLVLPVDQAEELFSADATEEARRFLALIGGVLRAGLSGGGGPSLSLIVAFTIRSDRYEPLQTAPELMGLKTVVFDALKPMPMAQFKEVITGPALRAASSSKRLEVKPDLVQQLLADSEQGGDTLPLLSLALSRLYRDYSSDGDMRLDEYQAMGGISNVIRTEIEFILSPDPETQKAQLEILHAAFIPWLATINPEKNEPMRRVARMVDLPSASQSLVQALIEKRLLLSDMRDGEEVVEVTHESLLRQWDILVKWLETEGDDLKEADRLEQAAGAWDRSSKRPDWLVGGERLIIWETLAAKPGYHRRLESAAEFLLCSRQREMQLREDEERHRQEKLDAAQEKQVAAEVLAAEQSRATERAQADSIRLKIRAKQLLGAAFGAVFLAIAAGYAFFNADAERKRAQLAQQHAQESSRKAQNALAGADFREAQRHYKENNLPYALAHLAHAVRLDSKWVASRSLLINLLQQRSWFLPIASFKHESDVLSAFFSANGTQVVTTSRDNTARLWDAATGRAQSKPMTHQGSINFAQFSTDGTRMVTASEDETSRLWDAATGKALGEPMTHQSGVNSAQFSTDGTRVVTASADKTARLWDAHTGKSLGEAMMHQGAVLSAQFSVDGTRVVTASQDKTARLWDARSGKPLGEAMTHQGTVWSAQFSPDGTRVVTASLDKTARLWDARSGKPMGEVMTHQDNVESAQFSADGTRVVTTAPADNTARLWDAHTGRSLGDPMTHQHRVWSAQFSTDGTRVVTASDDNTARLWDAHTGKSLGEAMTHQDRVWSAQFSTDGTRVVTVSVDKTARLWDARSGKSLGEAMIHQDAAWSAQFSTDGTRVVTASKDKTARLWDAATGKTLGEPMTHQSSVNSAQFSTDGTWVVTASYDKTARLWDARSGKPVGEAMTHQEAVLSAQFNDDSTRAVTASDDKTARLWDAHTGKSLGEAMMHQETVWSAQFSADGTYVVTASLDKTARLWDARNGKSVGEAMTHQGAVLSAQFNDDSTRVVTASDDKTARLWDAHTGKSLGEAMMHQEAVRFAQFSADGTRVVTASVDKTARLWDARSGKPLGEAMTHQDAVWSAHFNEDGTHVVTASFDKTARLWDARSGKPLGDAITHEGPVLSAQFSPNGMRAVTISGDIARLWDISPVVSDEKQLLSALAESVVGNRLSELGAIEAVEDQIAQINKLRERTANAPLGEPTAESFIRWFLSDPWTRTISPLSKLTVPEYIRQEIAAGRREQVEQAFPGHPLLIPVTASVLPH